MWLVGCRQVAAENDPSQVKVACKLLVLVGIVASGLGPYFVFLPAAVFLKFAFVLRLRW